MKGSDFASACLSWKSFITQEPNNPELNVFSQETLDLNTCAFLSLLLLLFFVCLWFGFVLFCLDTTPIFVVIDSG